MNGKLNERSSPEHSFATAQCFSFVSGLEEIAATVDKLITTDPTRAVELYETFLAGCHAKADELDDSSGSFGQFARDVICGWIKARQASGADPDRTASTLLGWMDDDPYAFCYEIEKDAVAAFDKAGLAAFEKQIRARFEAAAKEPSSWEYRNAGAESCARSTARSGTCRLTCSG